MFWINIIFWAIVVISMSISSRKPNFSYGYSSTIFDDYMANGCYEYSFYYILDSLYHGRYGVDDMILRFNNACSTCTRLSDRVFGKIALHIVKNAQKKTTRINTLYNISICLGYCCYDTIKTLFTICCFVAIFGHVHYSYLLDYMDISEKVLYYSIPIATFILTILVGRYVFKQVIGWQIIRYAFIIAFFISFPIAVWTHDWSTAYEDYTEYMEEEFGEDWEEELEDASDDAFYRRP